MTGVFLENQVFGVAWKTIFSKLFQNALISRQVDINAWNQLQIVSNIQDFHIQKEAPKNIWPLLSYSSLKCWPLMGSTHFEGYIHILLLVPDESQ